MPLSINTQVDPVIGHQRRTVMRGLIAGLAAGVLIGAPLRIAPSSVAVLANTNPR